MTETQRKMKKAFLCALAATLALTAAFAAPKKNEPVKLTVMSYNIRNGEAQDGTISWIYRAGASVEMLEDQAPDIFGVQEAYDYQVRLLTEFPGTYKSIGVGREDGKKEGEFMSIFYRKDSFKVLKWGTFWLSETPEKPSLGWDAACRRTATWALMKHKKSGKKFFYVNTHLDHVGWEARRNGLALIVDRIAAINPKGLPMVLTGDFNMTPERPEFEELNKRMKSARETAPITDHKATFHGWGRTNTPVIDYIYYSGFSACEKFETVTKGYMDRKFISDHYPVKAILVF